MSTTPPSSLPDDVTGYRPPAEPVDQLGAALEAERAVNRFARAETRAELIGQAVGAGSACWLPPGPGSSVFDVEQAAALAEEAHARLEELDRQHQPPDGPLLGLATTDELLAELRARFEVHIGGRRGAALIEALDAVRAELDEAELGPDHRRVTTERPSELRLDQAPARALLSELAGRMAEAPVALGLEGTPVELAEVLGRQADAALELLPADLLEYRPGDS